MNILEYKRKLLGHCFLKGDGGGGGGGGGDSRDSSATGARDSDDGSARAVAPTPSYAGNYGVSPTPAAPAGDSAPAAPAAPSYSGNYGVSPTPAAPAGDSSPAPAAPSYAGNYGVSPTPAAPAGDASPASTEAAPVASEVPAAVAPEATAALPAPEGVPPSFDFDKTALDAKKTNLQEAVAAKLSALNNEPKYQTLALGYEAKNDPEAIAQVMNEVKGKMTPLSMTVGGKNGDREISVDVAEHSFFDAFGRMPTYAEAKAMQAIGLGNMTGVNPNNMTATNVPVQGVEGLFTNEPGQTVDSIVATTDFVNFVGPIAKAAAMFIPGMSLAMTIKDFNEGKITVGDIASNFALGLLAKQFGISPATAKAMVNGDFGSAIASTMIGQLNPALSKELGVNPALAGILGQSTGAYGAVNSAFSGLNQNWGTTKSIANGFNSALQGIGITTGTGGQNGATGQSINTGFTTQDAIDHYINGGGGSFSAPAATPAPTPAAPATPAKAPAAGSTSKSSSSLDALGAAAFGLTGALGSGALASNGSSGYSGATSLSSVEPTSLSSNFQTKVIPNQPKFQGALEEFQQLQQSNDPNAVQYALSDKASEGIDMNPYTYGVDRPIGDILNPQDVAMQDVAMQDSGYGYSPDGVPEYMKTGIQAASGGAMTGTRYGKYARGGLSTPLMASGGKMRVDFRHGDAVTGAGDGQSDDIPAMLADGEFVFPADVVAAIGNGSTKAGSDKLYNMMHGIRAHVRSAKPKDLPPEIKSPLDFLKNTKRQGAKHG